MQQPAQGGLTQIPVVDLSQMRWPRSLKPAERAFVVDCVASTYADLLAELREHPLSRGRPYRALQRKAGAMWRAAKLHRQLCLDSWYARHRPTCWGCIEDQPNQLAHMDPGGCLHFMTEWPYDH